MAKASLAAVGAKGCWAARRAAASWPGDAVAALPTLVTANSSVSASKLAETVMRLRIWVPLSLAAQTACQRGHARPLPASRAMCLHLSVWTPRGGRTPRCPLLPPQQLLLPASCGVG